MSEIKASELVLASNGSLYHIHLTGSQLADNIFLVGDPARVDMFKDLFDEVEHESYNREIHALTGTYRGHRFTAISTGMGCDNIDIVVSELDAAANINLATRTVNPVHRSLNMIRIGTSGSLQPHIACGSLVASRYAVGLDGLLNYYHHDDSLFENELNNQFVRHMDFNHRLARPYSVQCDDNLFRRVAFDMTEGITATAPGFYAPQGRTLRIAPAVPHLNNKLASFSWNGIPVTNLEMETSAIYGLSRIMGHHALTVCLIIANRCDGTFLSNYHDTMKQTIVTILKRMV